MEEEKKKGGKDKEKHCNQEENQLYQLIPGEAQLWETALQRSQGVRSRAKKVNQTHTSSAWIELINSPKAIPLKQPDKRLKITTRGTKPLKRMRVCTWCHIAKSSSFKKVSVSWQVMERLMKSLSELTVNFIFPFLKKYEWITKGH